MSKRQLSITISALVLFALSGICQAKECKYEDILTWDNYKNIPVELCLEKTNNPEWPNWCDPDKTAWPNSFFVDSTGNIFLADPSTGRVIIYSSVNKNYREFYLHDSKSKVTLFSIGQSSNNTIIVANNSNGVVEEYDLTGKRLKFIAWDGFYPAQILTTVDGKIFLLKPFTDDPLDRIDNFKKFVYPPTKGYRSINTIQHQKFSAQYKVTTKSGKITGRKLIVSDDQGHVIKECDNINLEDGIPPYATNNGYLYYMPYRNSSKDKKNYWVSRIKILPR